MEKSIKLFPIGMLVLLSTFVSCQKNETNFGSPVDIQIVDSNSSDLKRSWKKGDQVKALFDNTMTTLTNKADDAQPANLKGVVKSEQYSLVKAFYPAACFVSKGEGVKANVVIPQSQEPYFISVDDRADFWMATPLENQTIKGDETLSMKFNRVSAILKVVLLDPNGLFAGKSVSSVTVDTKCYPITGTSVIDLSAKGGLICDGECTSTANYNTSDFKVDGKHAAFFALAPASFSADDVLSVAISFGNEIQNVDIVCGDAGLTGFTAGEITTLDVILEKTYFKGSGTPEDPWQISNFAELSSISTLLADESTAATYSTGCYLQTSDITVPDGLIFTPIGDSSHPFNGTYDGNDKTISNLTLPDQENAGLFGVVGKPADGETANVVIKNIIVDGLKYAGAETGGHAAIVGATGKDGETKINSCKVRNSKIEGAGSVGAIVSKITGKTVVDGCAVSNTSVIGSSSNVGGIAGVTANSYPIEIKNCSVGSKCEVNGAKGNVGGILGSVGKGYVEALVTIDNCAAYCIVRGGTQVIGGIIGGASPDVTSSEVVKAGGKTIISNCLYQGAEISTAYTSDANAFLGGIIGLGSRTADIAEAATSRGMSVHIVNCFTRPGKVISKVGPNTGRWSFGGISGGMFAGIHVWNCWSDITVEKMEIASGNLGHGSITTQINPAATYGNTADYCYGLIKLKNAGSGVVNGEVLTVDQMTTGYLLGKLTAGVAAYTGGQAVPSAWAAGTDGYPVISGIPADPEQ